MLLSSSNPYIMYISYFEKLKLILAFDVFPPVASIISECCREEAIVTLVDEI